MCDKLSSDFHCLGRLEAELRVDLPAPTLTLSPMLEAAVWDRHRVIGAQRWLVALKS